MTEVEPKPILEEAPVPDTAPSDVHTVTEEDGLTIYPQALATQEAVLEDAELFTRLLQDLNAKLQAAQPKKYRPSKYRVPTVAGSLLNLHELYRKVTAHGGVIAVTAENKWPEIIASFSFAAKVNLSAIKRIYSSLLWHFEQVYQHKAGGQKLHEPPELPAGAVDPALQDGLPTRPSRNRRGTSLAAIIAAADNSDADDEPAAAATADDGKAAAATPNSHKAAAGKDTATKQQQQQRPPRGNSSNTPAAANAPSKTPELVGFMKGTKARRDLTGQAVTGRVDARFDCGYFVSLHIAGQAFSGILYCPTAVAAATAAAAATGPGRPTKRDAAAAAAAAAANGSGGSSKREAAADAEASGRGTKRRRQQNAALDPNSASKPKSAKTAFNFFAAEQWNVVKAELGPAAVPQEISRAVGEKWNRTTEADRQPYIEKAMQDKSRFEQQMTNWRQGLESPPPAAAAGTDAAAAAAPGSSTPPAAAAETMDVDAAAAATQPEQQQYKHKLKLRIGTPPSKSAAAAAAGAAAAEADGQVAAAEADGQVAAAAAAAAEVSPEPPVPAAAVAEAPAAEAAAGQVAVAQQEAVSAAGEGAPAPAGDQAAPTAAEAAAAAAEAVDGADDPMQQ